MFPHMLTLRGPGAYVGAPTGGGGGGGTSDGGFVEEPIVITTAGRNTTIKGKVKPGSFGKFVYPLSTITAGSTYTFKYTPHFSQLTQQGKLAMVGFGLKNNNDFHIVGLRGDGATGVHRYKVYGTPPNGWNKDTGHTTSDGGAATTGTQAGPNYVRLITSSDGTTYMFQTSADGTTWSTEYTGAAPTPFTNVSSVTTFGVALWFNNGDTGLFSIDIELFASHGLWTPAQIATLFWFDASSVSNFTLSGSSVNTWNDLSGNANHITQGSAGDKPTRNTTTLAINGLGVVAYADDTDYLANIGGLTGFVPLDTTPGTTDIFTYAMLMRNSGGAANKGLFDLSQNLLTNTLYNPFVANSAGTFTLQNRAYGAGIESSKTLATDTTNAILWSGCGGKPRRLAVINGTEGTQNTTSVGTQSVTPTNFRLGRFFQDVFGGAAEVGEYVMFQGDNTSNRQKCEGYMAWKWGTTATLDAGHPYKTTPPTF